MIINPYMFSSGPVKAPPTIVYTGKFGPIAGASGGKTVSLPIGTAATDRMVVVLTYESNSSSSGAIYTRQVDGVNAHTIGSVSSTVKLAVFAVAIPTGTTTNLVWSTQFTANIYGVVYAVYGLASAAITTPKFNLTSGNTTTNTIDIPANGGAIGFRYTSSGVNGANGTTWTNLTRDTTTSGGANTIDISSANKTVSSAVTAQSVSAATNYGGYMTLVSFGNGA